MNLILIGQRLREARLHKELTQQELADQCGITKSMLSKIENGHSPAALATFSKIAKNLDLPLTWFLQDDDDERLVIIVGASNRGVRMGGNEIGYVYETLANKSRFSYIEPTVVTVPAILENYELFTHDEDEFIYVLEGSIYLNHDGNLYPLSVGDSAYFDGKKPHVFLPREKQEAKVIAIYVSNGRR